MTAYLGKLGALVGFKAPSAAPLSAQIPGRELLTLGGATSVQMGKSRARVWAVDIGVAEPADVAGLQEMVHGNSPPFVWVGPVAQVTNLLTPDQSTFANGAYSTGAFSVQTGAAVASDGAIISRWLLNAGDVAQSVYVTRGQDSKVIAAPVVPGKAVTFSAYLTSPTGPQIGVVWVDAALAAVGTAVVTGFGASTALTRRSVTLTPPAGAAAALLYFRYFGMVARPALTWTNTVRPWAIGDGCPSAWVDGLDQTPIMATEDTVLGKHSFNVRELYRAAG